MWTPNLGPARPFTHEEELDVYVAELLGAVKAFLMVYTEPGGVHHVLAMMEQYIAERNWPKELRRSLTKRLEFDHPAVTEKSVVAVLNALSSLKAKEEFRDS